MVFRIDLKIFLFLILLYFTRQIEIYSIIMIFILIHEVGHLLAGLFLKMKLIKLTLMPLGFSAEFKIESSDYNHKIFKSNKLEIKRLIVAIAGPITNILIIILTCFLKIDEELKQKIIYSNLLITIFNLLPIYPLDGGRVVKSLLNLLVDRETSYMYINRITNITLFFIIFVFSILIYYLKNITLLFILGYLLYIVVRENKIYKIKRRIYNIVKKM